jgi:hypothetical protein
MAEIEILDRLTPEQEKEFEKFKEKWIGIGENTDPMLKEEAREAVMDCYQLAQEELTLPEFVVFVQSPFQLFYGKPVWNRMADFLQTVKNKPELYKEDYKGKERPVPSDWWKIKAEETLDRWRLKAISTVFESIVDEVKDTVPDLDFRGDKRAFMRATAMFEDHMIAHYSREIDELVSDARSERGNEIYGQNETWLSFYDFMEHVGCKGLEGTHGLQKLAKAAGWWIPYDTVAFVSDRPCELHVDDEGSLHSHSRPAIVFRDGWRYYASHGTQIPEWIIEEPEKITAQKIDEESNVELRRIMLEIHGYDNYFDESKAVMIDKDENVHIGELWKKEMQDDEDIYFLVLQNSTQEPDGSHKRYIIRVPPTMRTAREANAWSYGFEQDSMEYQPALES